MDSAALLSHYGLYAGSALYGFLGGLIPILNVEAYLLILASVADTSRHWLLLSLVTAAAHMLAKSLLFAAGAGVGFSIPRRYHAGIERAQRRLDTWRYGPSALVFVSALVGLPPLYAVAILAGALRFGLVRFYVVGLAGRFLRFAAFLLFPQVCLRLLGYL